MSVVGGKAEITAAATIDPRRASVAKGQRTLVNAKTLLREGAFAPPTTAIAELFIRRCSTAIAEPIHRYKYQYPSHKRYVFTTSLSQ